MTRVAAVDLGTNSTRLLVADVVDGALTTVVRRLTITRLGEGVDARRVLLPAAITRVRSCLVEYRRELEALGAERTIAVATSAVRDAENGEAFLGEIEWSYEFTTRLLDGRDEAELMARGVLAGRASPEDVLLVDIGGGSTEFVHVVRGSVTEAVSLDVGVVRLSERFLGSDPPSERQLLEAAAHVRAHLPDIDAQSGIGVAGTVTTLAALDQRLETYDPERTHGHVVPRAAVDEWLARLASVPLAERLRVHGLEPGRAPVIVAGLVILREILEKHDLPSIEASEHDILDGAALAAAELPEPEEGLAPPGAYTCC